ncbi:MAG: PHP domain-containing protein [Anaerolineae bacterium]
MRVDLHVHTCASPDSLAAPDRIRYWARRRGIDAIAITDHNTIAMARELACLADLLIIIGEEVLTSDGEIIGLFLHEQVPIGSSVLDTARYIHEQGGLVYLPHPYDSLRHSAIHLDVLTSLLPSIDLIEVFNARVLKPSENRLAQDLADREHKPCGAGSDAHLACEVGRTFVDVPSFEGGGNFLQAMGKSSVHGRLASPLVHVGSSLARISKRIW